METHNIAHIVYMPMVTQSMQYAVLCTGAWIITGGTHTGVMKHVGQAVRDYALSNSMHSQIVAIGVATWGIIHNRETLVHAEVR